MCRVIMRKELNVPKINVVFRGVTVLVKTYKIKKKFLVHLEAMFEIINSHHFSHYFTLDEISSIP